MLIQFKVGNYKSFKEPVTLSLVAAKIKGKDANIDENNLIRVDDKLELLTSAAVYGANASGKSNLFGAFKFMRRFIINSSKESQVNERIEVEPFLLDAEYEINLLF